jgi:hypothetical protein
LPFEIATSACGLLAMTFFQLRDRSIFIID